MKIAGILLAATAALSLSAATVQAGDSMTTASVHVNSQVTRLPNTTAADKLGLLHKTAGYCNGYGCFGNICYTPVGSCVQVNFSPVGGSCYCASTAGPISGTTGS